MAIALIIEPPPAAGMGPFRFALEGDAITIGRGADNDLVIADRTRALSTHHARLEFRGNQYWITDLGSTNGSSLNGHPLVAQEAEVVVAGDRIGLATYTVRLAVEGEVVAASPEAGGTRIVMAGEAAFPPLPEVVVVEDPATILRRRVRHISAALGELAPLDGEARKAAVARTLHEAFEPLLPAERTATLAALREVFPDRPHVPPAPAVEAAPVDAVPAAGIGDLRAVLAVLLGRADLPADPAWQAAAGERLARVVPLLVDGLSALLAGRREFEVAYDASATRYHGLGANRVKLRATGQEEGSVASYLFDPEQCTRDAEAEQAVREATEDCLRHQLGLLHGLKRCVREALAELDPQRVEAEVAGKAVKVGPLSIPVKSIPGKQTAWRRYVERYAQVAAMDEATFNRLLRPVLARGWLEMQQRGGDESQ
ncbi:MAG: type VI secretion system-associated FHA domain protein TagH [Nitrospirae bacterium CG_4_10_14_3_um_filter_70_108]|nr:MAG: type VI secretion system-associated FHA domain protein TagH [Nitrospirae bacterium CG_4_10_14_3_um_filter_70_108]